MAPQDHRRREETGASAVEYGLLAAGVAGVCVAAILAMGGATGEMFSDTCGEFAANSQINASCS